VQIGFHVGFVPTVVTALPNSSKLAPDLRVEDAMKALFGIVAATVAAFILIRVFANGPTGDCDAVAEDMASYELGNYAEPDQRAPAVEKYRAMCRDVKVTKEQSACLAKATNKLAAARCAPAMFPDIDVPDCDDDTDCVMKTMEKFSDRMCACKTRACADGVSQDMNQWGQSMAQSAAATMKPTPEATKKMSEIVERFSRCYQKLLTP
jgi:hypothetical protein